MILAGQWPQPLPEKPRNREEANDRGFDPDSLRHDQATPEPTVCRDCKTAVHGGNLCIECWRDRWELARARNAEWWAP